MSDRLSNNYIIMQGERRVASVNADGTCVIFNPALLPYNIWLEEADDLDTRLNNLENFYHWCASRVLTLGRKYAKEILNSIGASQAVTDRDRARIAISYHALSLTDIYWVRLADEELRFADISLFAHSLSDAFVDVSLRGKQLTAENAELLVPSDAAGDVGTSGVAPKAWIRRDGVFYLLKDGDPEEVEAELLASKIARCFDVRQVIYEPDEYDGQTVSKSKIISSPELSLVPIEYVEIYAQNHDTTRQAIIEELDPYAFHMMNIVDYLVGNTDRHWGNWGFYADNETNRLTKLYPLMDFNKAFTAYDTIEGVRCQTTAEPMSQKDAAIAAVRAVGINQIAEIDPAWFRDEAARNMFFERLKVLQ